MTLSDPPEYPSRHPLSHKRCLRRAGKWTSVSPWTAALAYNTEAERIGGIDLNVIPAPAGDADDDNNAAALALLGRAVQVDPIKPTSKSPGTNRLKLKCL